MKWVWLFILFFILYDSGESVAFPGAPFHDYSLAYGNPSNLKSLPQKSRFEKTVQYYWQEVEVDPLSLGKKLKGNFIVLFENRGETPSHFQEITEFNLWSLQETFLAQITAVEFLSVMEGLSGKWKTVSKTTHRNANRTYDLYQMVSGDEKYLAELSYSSPESIFPIQTDPSSLPPPLFNFWIHVTPKH